MDVFFRTPSRAPTTAMVIACGGDGIAFSLFSVRIRYSLCVVCERTSHVNTPVIPLACEYTRHFVYEGKLDPIWQDVGLRMASDVSV